MPKIDVHKLWRLKPKFDKETGALIAHGLRDHLGPEGTVRELRKRCEAEVEHAGKPLAGCSMYASEITHWVAVCLNNHEPAARRASEDFLTVAGAHEFVDLVEETWKEHKGAVELPSDVKYELLEEVKETLDDRYGEIIYNPEHLSPAEIEQSKLLALSLGKRKRRAKSASPVPEETQEVHEPEPEEPPEATAPDIRAEIDAKIKRAR